MKRSILLIVLLFSIAIGNSQTITEVTNQMLGQIIDNKDNQRIKTDYGTFNFKIKTEPSSSTRKKIMRIEVTISNDFQMYDSIINSGDYQTYKVGSMWTDLIFKYEEVITKEFEDLSSAKEYADTYISSPYVAYQDVKVYKHPKKEIYKVTRLTQSGKKNLVRFDDSTRVYDETKWWKEVK